jgi:hypothetical protein
MAFAKSVLVSSFNPLSSPLIHHSVISCFKLGLKFETWVNFKRHTHISSFIHLECFSWWYAKWKLPPFLMSKDKRSYSLTYVFSPACLHHGRKLEYYPFECWDQKIIISTKIIPPKSHRKKKRKTYQHFLFISSKFEHSNNSLNRKWSSQKK